MAAKLKVEINGNIVFPTQYILLLIGECVCVCVCLSVCLCVCPAIRFNISQRIFSKFGGNIIWVMTRIVCHLLV
jgi:hypothetical protein